MIRQPRQKNEAHLDGIRQLPCLVCLDPTCTEAAHIRMGDLTAGKRHVGTGEKSDDAFAVPLCGYHHRMQHSIGEERFWREIGIDPIRVALALWKATGNHELGENIIRANRANVVQRVAQAS